MKQLASSNVGHPVAVPEKKRRRRRRRFLLAVVLLLAGTVWLTPYLFSTGPGCDLIVSIINDRIKGTLRIGEISLSWFGPCRVSDLRAIDLNGREVLRVEEIRLDAGLLGLLKNAERFEHVSIASAHVMLYLNAEGVPSLSKAFEPTEPSPTKGASAPKGGIAVTNGMVTIIRADGRKYEIQGINALISLDTLDRIKGNIDFAPSGGGRISVAMNLSDLTDGEEFRLDNAGGTFSLVTDEPVSLARLAEFAGSRSGLDGAARISVNGNIAAGEVTAGFDMVVLGLRAGGSERSSLRPTDLNLIGNFKATKEEISGDAKLTGEAVNLHAFFSYKPSDAPLRLSWEDILAAAFGGESITLPGVSLDVPKADINLPKLARAVPAMLKVLPDVEITSGTIVAKDISIRGGSRPSVQGRVTLNELRAARKGQAEVSCRPISLSLNAAIDREAGLKIDIFKFTSGFGSAEGEGDAADFTTHYQLNLKRFHEKPGEIFDIGSAFPQGLIKGTLNLARRKAGRVDLLSDVEVENFKYRAGERTLHLDKLRITQKGYLLLQKRKLLEAVVTSGEIKLAKELLLAVSGRYHFDKKTFQCDVDIEKADLMPLKHRFRNWIPADLPKISGSLTGKIALSRPIGGKHLVSSGGATLLNLRVDGQSPTDRPINLEWSGLKLDPDFRRMDVASAKLVSDPMTLLAEKVRLILSEDFRAEGKVDISANLAKCLAAAQPFVKWEKPPRISGALTWKGKSSYTGKDVRLSGNGKIKDISVGSGEKTLRQKNITFAHVAILDHARKRITLEKMDVASKALSLKMGGTIDRFGSDWMLDLSGSYEGSWKDLTALLHEFAPATKAKVSLTGKTGGQVVITGPARKPEVRPAFRGVKAKTAFGWEHADFFGIGVEQAKLSPVLADGQVRIPETIVVAGDGKVRLAGTIDLRGDDPVFRLPGRVRVLENLKITPQLNKELLTRFNPIFAELVDVEGKVSLDTTDLLLPLNDRIKQIGSGRGHLDLQKLKVRPKGILAKLVKFGMADARDQSPVQVRGVDFVIRDGRINYDNFTLVLPGGFDLKFYGSVGFDDTLDLAVSVPISAALLEKFNVRGPVIDYARLLAGARVDIPMVGSRLKPRLNFSKVDIRPLIDRAIKSLLAEQAGKMLEDLLKDRRKKDKDPKDKDKDKDKTEEIDPFLDSLFDLLKKPKPSNPK